MGLKRGFFVYFVIGLFLLPEILASINLISLQGNVDESGVAVPYGNLTVQIYDQITGGNLLYNSTTDFYGSIVDGKYDVVLGNGSNNLDLEYGDVYYLELIINGEAFTFNGSSRQIFQSSVGKINGNFINNTQINQTHLALNLNLSNATDIRSSAVIKTTGTNFLGTALDSILDTLNQRINDVNTSATVWNVSGIDLHPLDLDYRVSIGAINYSSNATFFVQPSSNANTLFDILRINDINGNDALRLYGTVDGGGRYFHFGGSDFVVIEELGSYFDSSGLAIGLTPGSELPQGELHVKSSGLTEVRIEGSGDTGGNLTFFDEGNYYGGIYYNPGGEFVNLRSIGDLNLIAAGVYASGNLYANGNLVNQWLYNQSTYAINYADATFLRNDGDNGTGEYNFNGGWQNDGVTIENGNLFAQTLYVYNLSSLEVSSLSVNGSVLPPVDFNNSFDLGSGSRIWRNLYLGENATILGQVGIGTNNPSGDLEITDTSQITDLIVKSGNTDESNTVRIDLERGAFNGTSELRFRTSDIDRENWVFAVPGYSNDLSLSDFTEDGMFSFSTEVLRIQNGTGFIGIKGSTFGSVNPSHELNVVGDTNITGSLYVSNNLVDQWLYNQTISVFTGSLLNSTIDARDDSNWNLSGSNLFPGSLSYSVGIGTSSPEENLHIKADDATTGLQIGEQADSFWTFLGSNGLVFNRAGATSYIDQQGVGGNLAFRVSESSSADTTALTILDTGEVGIGTVSPRKLLEVRNSVVNGAQAKFSYDDSYYLDVGYNKILSYFPSAGTSDLFFGVASTPSGNGHNLYLQTSNTTRITIEDTGEVGIGDTSPSSSGGTGFKTSIKDDAQYALYLANTNSNDTVMLGFGQQDNRRAYVQYLHNTATFRVTNEYGDIAFLTGTNGAETQKFVIKSDGDVGIGTSTPQTIFDVWNNDSSTSLWSRASSVQIVNQNKGTNTWEGIQFSDGDQIAAGILTQFNNPGSNQGKLYLSARGPSGFVSDGLVLDDGDIGIRNSNPGYTLDVTGNDDLGTFRVADTDAACVGNPESGSFSWSCSSTELIKTNITKPNFEEVKSNFLKYTSTIRKYNVIVSGEEKVGTIAEDLLGVRPDLVIQDETLLVKEYPEQEVHLIVSELIKENDLLKEELCQRDNSYSWC